VHIADAARLPQQVRSIDPAPEQLPHDGEPPLPAFGTISARFFSGALDRVVEKSVARVELLRPKIDKDRKQELDLKISTGDKI
jgi:hypothetical protein